MGRVPVATAPGRLWVVMKKSIWIKLTAKDYEDQGTIAAIGSIIIDSIAKIRKYKSENKLATNCPLDHVYLDFDDIVSWDIVMGSAPYDLLGCTNAEGVTLRMLNKGVGCYEEARTWRW